MRHTHRCSAPLGTRLEECGEDASDFFQSRYAEWKNAPRDPDEDMCRWQAPLTHVARTVLTL
jgi:hypothetical protein